MDTDRAAPMVQSPMTAGLFTRFKEFIESELGIKMPDTKHIMLRTRLQKRMRRLSIDSFEDYYRYVFSPQGRDEELQHMLDAVTTNKTDFFREPKHFEILVQQVLPALYAERRLTPYRPLAVWSAGCSTGAEPYTLAMVLSDALRHYPETTFKILATDISMRVLRIAQEGIYEERESRPVPMAFKKQYLLRGKDRLHPKIRIVPELRKLVQFRRLNFMSRDFAIRSPMDIVFCRNVIIYFDRPTQTRVVGEICRNMRAGGFLFMGHSETLNGMQLPLRQLTANVYRKLDHSGEKS